MTTIDLAKLSSVCGGAARTTTPSGQQPDPAALERLNNSISVLQEQQRRAQEARSNRVMTNLSMCEAGKSMGVMPQWVDCMKWAQEAQ